jgi:glycosyltransferase involved in cell wall biosynthesis
VSLGICFLSAAHPPFDKRVYHKEALSLAEAGFDVVHICPGEPSEQRNSPVRVLCYPRRKGWGRLKHLVDLYRLALGFTEYVFHCNEPDSWLVGLWLKFKTRSRVVFDVHEYYPGNIGRKVPKPLEWIAGLMVRALFAVCTRFTDRLVFAKRSVVDDFPDHARKGIFVLNYAPLSVRDRTQDQARAALGLKQDDMIRIVHLGLASKMRGWPQILEAMARAESKRLHADFIGEINDGSIEEFKQTAGRLKLSDRVKVWPWMEYEEAFDHLLCSDIGIIAFQPGVENHVRAMPHKMFDYMLAGLPVIIPDFAVEVAPSVKEEACGILVDPSDPISIALAFDRLASSPTLRKEMGSRGRDAVLRKYNWEAEARTLVEMYRGLAVAEKKLSPQFQKVAPLVVGGKLGKIPVS